MSDEVSAEDPGRMRALTDLRRWNLGVGGLHLGQAVAILALGGAVSLPVTVTYLTGPPGAGQYGGPTDLFDLRIDVAVAVFLLLAAIDHRSVGTWARRWYERQVVLGINPARWWEYALSASLMVVLIAMLARCERGASRWGLEEANAG